MARKRIVLLLVLLPLLVALGLLLVDSIPAPVRGALLIGACAGLLLFKRRRPELFEPPAPRVEIDGDGVRRLRGDQLVEQVSWAELVKVSIMTTDEGPGAEDVFLLLHAADGTGCAVPHELACAAGLLDWLQRLPGFDNAAVIEAMGSTEWQEFVCWEGRSGEGQAAVEPDDARSSSDRLRAVDAQ
jgi:hypothetical protein